MFCSPAARPHPRGGCISVGGIGPSAIGCNELWDPGGGASPRVGRRGRGDVPVSCSHGLSLREGTEDEGVNLCESLRAWPAAPTAGQGPPAVESPLQRPTRTIPALLLSPTLPGYSPPCRCANHSLCHNLTIMELRQPQDPWAPAQL
ncbi:hypothetical protein KIL84_004907 [Mauremys mutica]|uniref:Uncharacterized protein n=1 Tax=Mauremys mutica TaxID=74926 RepID=A0A9D3XQL4_9SAUR|nr:hypothetical protein KIL84_004907 [Mauremys mutica]